MRCARFLLLGLVALMAAVAILLVASGRQHIALADPPPPFGDGSDGPIVYTTNTIDSPIDSAASGTVGGTSLSATNPGFATGQKLLVHQTRGANSGVWEINEIQAYSAGTITTTLPLQYGYWTGGADAAQVLVLREYTDLTVNPGVTVTSKAWDGSVGGVFAVLVSGTATVEGTISASGRGFRGGPGGGQNGVGWTAEGTDGPAFPSNSNSNAYGNAGLGDIAHTHASMGGGGGGGGNDSIGGRGWGGGGQPSPRGGLTSAIDLQLNRAIFGGGGGGASGGNSGGGGSGGSGGGIVYVAASNLSVSGGVAANGTDGSNTGGGGGGGGGGAGGAILLRSSAADTAAGILSASGGNGGNGPGGPLGGAGGLAPGGHGYPDGGGGAGGNGRLRVEAPCADLPPQSVTIPLFGNGDAGSREYVTSQAYVPVDSAAAGQTGETILAASNPLFLPGATILVHQTRGAGAGTWELNRIQAYCSGFIVTANPLASTYRTGASNAAQVLMVPEYTDLTIAPGVTLSTEGWDGVTGGIFAAFVENTAVIDGTLLASARGFRGGQRVFAGGGIPGCTGEGTSGASYDTPPDGPNGNGGGVNSGLYGSHGAPGGGGGNATNGDTGIKAVLPVSPGGAPSGTPDLTSAAFGGGGAGSTAGNTPESGNTAGGAGGGMVFLFAWNLSLGSSGAIAADGEDGEDHFTFEGNGGGGGAGGSVLLRLGSGELGTAQVNAAGGAGGIATTSSDPGYGGNGSAGRIRVEYCETLSGSTNPPASVEVSPDIDGDGWCDLIENCPGVPTRWFTPAGDGDCDGWSSEDEGVIGTDGADACADNPADDAWPCDFDDNQVVNISDVFKVLPPYFGMTSSSPGWDPRRDLVPDGVINIADVFKVLPPYFGSSCTP